MAIVTLLSRILVVYTHQQSPKNATKTQLRSNNLRLVVAMSMGTVAAMSMGTVVAMSMGTAASYQPTKQLIYTSHTHTHAHKHVHVSQTGRSATYSPQHMNKQYNSYTRVYAQSVRIPCK